VVQERAWEIETVRADALPAFFHAYRAVMAWLELSAAGCIDTPLVVPSAAGITVPRCHEDLRAAVIATSPNEICCCIYNYIIIILILVPLSRSSSSESNRRSSGNTMHAQSILMADACSAACLETCESREGGWDAVFKAAGARLSEK
jgi:hypothetical protein